MEKGCKDDAGKSRENSARITQKTRRKRKCDGVKKDNKKYSNILFSCITVRQLRDLLDKVEKETFIKNNDGVEMKTVSKGGGGRRLAANKTKQRGVKRSRRKSEQVITTQDNTLQPETFVTESQQVTVTAPPDDTLCTKTFVPELEQLNAPHDDALNTKTFPVAAISMGLFIANGGPASNSACSVTFCFLSRHLQYDFSYKSGSLTYTAGYRVPFSNLEAIIFQGSYVNFKLSQVAEQVYCNRENIMDVSHTVVPCNDFDITLGQYRTALIHVVRMISDESSVWIYHLLNADQQFFKLLIRKSALDGSGPVPVAVDPDPSKVSTLPTLTVNPASAPMYGDQSGTQHFVAPGCPQPPLPYMAPPGTMNSEAIPVCYGEPSNASLPTDFMSYPIQQQQNEMGISQPLTGYDDGGNAWNPEMFMRTQSETCPAAPESTALQNGVTSNQGCVQQTADAVNNGSGLQMAQPYSEGIVEEQQGKAENDPSTISSMYVLPGPVPVDSEYVPQKSDSQYILSDLDMLFP